MDMELDFIHGPCFYRNFTEDELFLEAKRSHYNSECYRPSFLIRIHNLTFKRVAYGGVKSKSNFQPQDLTINIRRGEIYSVGQPDSFDKSQEEGERIDEDNTTINLFGDSYSPFVSDEHFALGREEDGKAWIRDLNSKQGTFVNGAKLSPQINHYLKEGDIVSLGISHLHPKCQLDKGIFWVFKYKEVSEEEETYLKSLYSQVLGNTVILSNILTTIYEPYKNLFGKGERLPLTNIRSVSKFWNEISTPILGKKMVLHFKLNQQRYKFLGDEDIPINRKESMDIWREQFDANVVNFSSLGVRNLSLREDILFHSTEIRATEVKFYQDFLCQNGHKFSKIVLEFQIEHGAKLHKNRGKVLQNLFKECKSVKEFRINADCSQSLSNVEPSMSTTKLRINTLIDNYENLFRAFPNIVELSLGSYFMTTFFNFMSSTQNREFAEDALKHLKVLKILPICLPYEDNFVKLFDLTKFDFPIKIEEFSLQDIPLEENPLFPLPNAISRFSEGLLKLNLSFAAPEKMLKALIRLPEMEKLEELEISINNPNVLECSFELGGFPNLKGIIIKSDRREDCEGDKHNFLESLLSGENRVHFPKLGKAFVSYGELQSKNFV